MADLTEAGLLFAPHTSAGRLPTEQGLRLFVDGLLHFGEVAEEDREAISAALAANGRSLEDTLAEAGSLLSGLSSAAGLVLAPKSEGPVRHIDFVPLGPGRALVILVNADGHVENRVIETPPGLPPSALQQASNYLNARLSGRPLAELRAIVAAEMAADRTELDQLRAKWSRRGSRCGPAKGRGGSLIVRGQARLLSDITQIERLAAIQALFERLETQETMLRLLDSRSTPKGSDLHRRGERLVRHLGRVDDRGSGPQRGRPHCRGARGDRADAHQLWPHHTRGGLHRPRDRAASRLAIVA